MIHLRTGTNKANDQHKNLCGGPASNATNNPPFVTCRQCLEKMKELEQERGDPYAKNGVYEFVRKGGSNYKDMWNKQEDLDFLYNTAGTLMRKLGYEMQ